SIIKTRLLIDSRPLKKCLRRFYTLYSNLPAANAGAQQILVQFLADLSQFEASILKYQLLYEMNQHEILNYESECLKIENEAAQTKNEIIDLKVQLEEAQRRRKNKMEYDEIAREINKIATRASSRQNIFRLKDEIEKLKNERQSLEKSQDLRRKAMNELVHSLYNVKDMITEEKEINETKRLNTTAFIAASQPAEDEEEGILFDENTQEKVDAMDLN
ncbi:hypothetical protein HK096_002988, partial [Nowakowskiella sp. JEL0078]